MIPGPRIPLLAAALFVAVALAACGQQPRAGGSGPAASKQQLTAAQASLHTEAGRLLDGGVTAFEARLAGLRGVPVVVNQWASWCGPCRYEFPFFAHLAKRYDGRVAFLGVNSQDVRGDAAAFLKKLPVPYPHYYDKDALIARTFGGGRSWPTTAFFAASGKLVFTHIGSYAAEAKLDEDITRYALHG